VISPHFNSAQLSLSSILLLLQYITTTTTNTTSTTTTTTTTVLRPPRPCPGLPGWAGTRKVKPIWISLKQETVSGSGISWAICKSAACSRQITTPVSHHSVNAVINQYCYNYCYDNHFTALWVLSGTTWVNRYQKGKTKTNLDFLEQEWVSGSGISWVICKSAPRPRQISTTLTPHHSAFYMLNACFNLMLLFKVQLHWCLWFMPTSCAMPTVDESSHSAMGTVDPHHNVTFFLYIRPTLYKIWSL